jgi:hypothetical protein
LALVACVLAFPAKAAPQVDLASHEAIYRLSMSSARNGSPVVGVAGRMQLTFNDACDGWTVEQKFQLHFTYAEGEDVDMSTNYVTWESKDGKRFRFNTRKLTNGKPDETLQGDASLTGAGGVVRYKAPKETEVPLPAGTVFPTAHTVMLVEHARQGEHFFARPLFDGSDAEGGTIVTAVIGAAAPVAAAGGEPSAELKRDKGWPIHLAFYPTDPTMPDPEYENTQTQLDNGIVQSMVIDYGTFKVNAVLESLKALPKPTC